MRKRILFVLAGTAVWAAAFFVCAGSLRIPRAWLTLALTLAWLSVNGIVVARKNPTLAAERWKRRADTKGFDRVLAPLYALFVFAVPAVAGLDARFGWSPFPWSAVAPGALLSIFGMAPITWAMATNPHLETTVRIQSNRGHRVISSGPYAYVRHPMYAGLIVQNAGLPLMFGSGWAYAPAAAIALVLVVRAALEDRTLRRELPGYEEYAARTRYRLAPGIW